MTTPTPYDPSPQDSPLPATTIPASDSIPSPRSTKPSWLAPSLAGMAIGAALGATITFAAIGGSGSGNADAAPQGPTTAPAPTADARFAKAFESCALQGSTGIKLADGNKTITVDTKGKDDYSGATYEDAFCVLGALAAPTATLSHIQQTTSMDGRQSATWDGVTFSWSYHPDRGLDGVLTLD